MGGKSADTLDLIRMVQIDALTWAKDIAINAGKLSEVSGLSFEEFILNLEHQGLVAPYIVATDIMEKIDELKGDKGSA